MSEKEFVQLKVEQLLPVKATIDWGLLRSGRGVRRLENVAQIILGRILLWLCLVIDLGIVVSEVVRGYRLTRIIEVSSLEGVIFWIVLLIFIYALYLLRDREWFLDAPRSHTLYQLRHLAQLGKLKKNIEITDYLTHELLWLLDHSINLEGGNYLVAFWERLIKMPKAQGVIFRLGLTKEQFDMGILERHSSMDDMVVVIRQLLVQAFEVSYEFGTKYVGEDIVTFVFLERFFRDFILQYNITDKDLQGIGLWLTNEAKKSK